MAISAPTLEHAYRSKIIKAGALIADTRALFAYWDREASTTDNLQRLCAGNLLGKSSRSRAVDVLAIFRQRYLTEPGSTNALATLIHAGASLSVLVPIFYFHAAQSDPLLHDTVTNFLAPLEWHGRAEISTDQLMAFLADQVRSGQTAGRWSEPTTRRVAQGLLSTLRDFGVLAGPSRSPKKHLTPTYLPMESFAYVAFLLARRLHSGDQVLSSGEWRLFFLSQALVERLFVEAQLERLLTYNAAGRIVRIDFPAESIEEYALALAQRAH